MGKPIVVVNATLEMYGPARCARLSAVNVRQIKEQAEADCGFFGTW